MTRQNREAPTGPRPLDPDDFAPADLFDHLAPPTRQETTMSSTATEPDETDPTESFTELLTEALWDAGEQIPGGLTTRSFADAGVLTTNAGIVVRLGDGTEFQVTVVRSR